MDNENLISVYLKLLGVLECPVCLEYLSKPVGLCQEGHALCSRCKINVSNCPMCRNPISSTRGLIVDQIIETLLYPCYKMGCGTLLRRSEAEAHDQCCFLEMASDKQTVLHNNLLKNIEDNFSSFLVQPEIPKDTRTVGTVTGKVKMCDVRVQTVLPFLITGSGDNHSESGSIGNLPGSSRTVGNQSNTISSSGVSIAYGNALNQAAGSNNSPFKFLLNPVLDHKSGPTFMNSLNTRIIAPDMNINLFKKSNMNVPQNFKGLWSGSGGPEDLAQPCRFSIGNGYVPKPNFVSSSKKPSTNLNFNIGNSSTISGTETMDTNNVSASIKNVDGIPDTSHTSQTELISTQPASTLNNPLLNNSSISNNNQPCASSTTVGTSNKKRPSTNLYHIITHA